MITLVENVAFLSAKREILNKKNNNKSQLI